jgi:hypothetical protein
MRKANIKNLIVKSYLILLLIWGVASFFLFSGLGVSTWPILFISLISIMLVIYKTAKQFLLVYISFLLLYGIYGFQYIYNFPLWVAIIMLTALFSLLIVFLYSENQRISKFLPLYVSLFVLINIELYLTLSFWLANPLSRSFIAALSVYVFSGYLESIDGDNFEQNKFNGYLFTATALLVILLLTSAWGR